MRVRASITLEDTTLRAVDAYAANAGRSRVIEAAILEFLAHRRPSGRDANDRAILEQNATDFAALMADVLGDQREPEVDTAVGIALGLV